MEQCVTVLVLEFTVPSECIVSAVRDEGTTTNGSVRPMIEPGLQRSMLSATDKGTWVSFAFHFEKPNLLRLYQTSCVGMMLQDPVQEKGPL